jgi:hypothetical protein
MANQKAKGKYQKVKIFSHGALFQMLSAAHLISQF